MDRRHGCNGQRAFTLVELLVVITIIAVLIGILLPALNGARNTARKTATQNLMMQVKTGISSFKSQNGRLPGFFSAQEMGSAANLGITQMENVLVELGGGRQKDSSNQAMDQVVRLEIGTRRVFVDVLGIGADDSGSYISIPARGVADSKGAPLGIGPALAGRDQVVMNLGGASKYQMPDVLDAWGKPILLWMKNESAGSSPQFAENKSSGNRALFYWRSNFGYLDAVTQKNDSALGTAAAGSFAGNPPSGRARTMEALLGHPAFPDGAATPGNPRPQAPLADFVVQSAGVDGIFLDNGGKTGTEYRYLPKGVDVPNGWGGGGWGLIENTDDIILAGD